LQKLLPAEFVGICEDLGFQDDEIKKLKKEFEKAQAK
jgi:predicted HicB family RNase H-like nuclease